MPTGSAAALALGHAVETTLWPSSAGKPGLLGAVFLGLRRAMGETITVTMLIGNRPEVSLSLWPPDIRWPR